MDRKEEIQAMATAIIDSNHGQAYFNFEQASRIIDCGRHTLARKLHEAGITVKRVGPSKRISAYVLATFMRDGQIAPIDNISR